MSLKELAPEVLQEMSMIEMAYKILNGNKQAVSFQEIWDEIVEVTGMSEGEARARIAQFYTDLNIDGRFIALGENRWGLRAWYPVDQIEDDAVSPAKTKAKKKKKSKKVVDEEDFDNYDEDDEEELEYEDLDEVLEEEDEDPEDADDDFDEEDEEDEDEDLDELDDDDIFDDEELDDEEFEEDEDEEEDENIQY